MSTVRMCDRCGTIFSTARIGWTELQGQQHMRYRDGGEFADNQKRDFCPDCSNDMTGTKVPMVEVPSIPPPVQ